jgi:DNA-binding response OmpR family regulator
MAERAGGNAMAKVMIVDDEQDLLETMATVLELNGHKPVKVLDGADAMTTAIIEQPDLILLDVMLPHRTGWSLCKDFQDNPLTDKIPIVIVSARFQQEDVDKGIKAGAKDYLIKPFSLEELLDTVNHWAAQAS